MLFNLFSLYCQALITQNVTWGMLGVNVVIQIVRCQCAICDTWVVMAVITAALLY